MEEQLISHLSQPNQELCSAYCLINSVLLSTSCINCCYQQSSPCPLNAGAESSLPKFASRAAAACTSVSVFVAALAFSIAAAPSAPYAVPVPAATAVFQKMGGRGARLVLLLPLLLLLLHPALALFPFRPDCIQGACQVAREIRI